MLLVEDHPALAAATAQVLRDEKFEVRTALSGQEALDAAPHFQPQLILCDLNLPDMRGHEVIRRLRSSASGQGAYAVVLSGLSESEIRAYNRSATALGVDEFISKPVKPEMVRTLAAKLRPRRRSSLEK